jgi:hypothetical protein
VGAVGDDLVAVLEGDAIAGTAGHHLGHARDTAGPTILVEQVIADPDRAHGRPAGGRWKGNVERERPTNLRSLHEDYPLER